MAVGLGRRWAMMAGAAFWAVSAPCVAAEGQGTIVSEAPAQTYSDIVDLSDSAPSILQAEVRLVAPLERARADGVRPGWARLYVEARPLVVLKGGMPDSQMLRYLADVPLDARGKVPSLKKRQVLLFAHAPADALGNIQLVAPDAQLMSDPVLEARVRSVIGELAAPGAPPKITGVSQALYEPGTLAGQGETQLFLTTGTGTPASITVTHEPGEATRWSVSFSEVVNPEGKPPAHDTMAWYRLACSLPDALPTGINISETVSAKAQAVADYQLVRETLGSCARNRK